MILGKRGVSTVVATVLIILLVLVAVTILWAAIRPTLEQTTEQISASCITLDLEITACDTTGEKIEITRHTGQGDLQAVKLIVDGVPCANVDASTLGELENMNAGCDTHADFITGDSVQVAAVLSGGNLCEPLRQAFDC